jgi:hypothetical protein
LTLWGILAETLPMFLLAAWFAPFLYLSDLYILPLSSCQNFRLRGTISDERRRLAALTPVMSRRDGNMFYRYLAGVNVYFEFGSGGSTAQAALRVPRVISVESDAQWHKHLRDKIGHVGDITWYTVDLRVPLKGWGAPGSDSPPSDWPNYTHAYVSTFGADLILIDGRFRVSCALCVFSHITNRTFVRRWPCRGYHLVHCRSESTFEWMGNTRL